MQFSQVSLVALAISMAEAIGFSTYKDILQNRDNSAQIAYNSLPPRSHTLFLYIQIIAGSDHSSIIQDFKALVSNYGPHGVSIIPRVRYGNADGSVTTEPTDQGTILKDVSEWAQVFSEVTGQIDIPVIQAGFLGPWGEWHDGPFCSTRGSSDSTVNLNIKRQIVTTLQGSGKKIALRYPEDHKQLYPGDRSVTIHDDCIFDGGPNGYDGGTFPSSDREGWVDYTIQVASNNTFGGEGCDDAGTSTYDWSNYDDICSSSGIASYLDMLGMAYMNTGNPSAFQSLIDDSSRSSCVDLIQEALESHS